MEEATSKKSEKKLGEEKIVEKKLEKKDEKKVDPSLLRDMQVAALGLQLVFG